MYGSALPRLACASITLVLFAMPVRADVAVAPDTVSDSYRVLQRLGLLKTQPVAASQARQPATGPQPVAPAAGERVAVTVSETVVDAVPRPAARNQASSEAYDVLRRLGLLPAEPGAAPKATVRRADVRVLVEKSKRRLYVLRNGKPFREYPVMLGGAPNGHKRQEGDLRTPEGVYTLDWRNPRSRYYKSIHISYPGPQDRLSAEERGVKPGGMVMLHGEHDDPAIRRILRRRARDWTEGCIALNNEHIDEIWRVVPDGTPIEIRP